MNDDQCNAIIESIKCLTHSIDSLAEGIVNALDNLYSPDNGGLERRMDKLIDSIYDTRG